MKFEEAREAYSSHQSDDADYDELERVAGAYIGALETRVLDLSAELRRMQFTYEDRYDGLS